MCLNETVKSCKKSSFKTTITIGHWKIYSLDLEIFTNVTFFLKIGWKVWYNIKYFSLITDLESFL